MTHTRPVRAEISRNKLIANYRLLRRLAGAETELLAAVKANAYGHGAAACATVLAGESASWFGVTCVEEGVVLRAVPGFGARILVMSGIWQGEAETAIQQGLTPVVWEPWHLDWLEKAAGGLHVKAQNFPVFLEIDTGMSRQGVRIDGLGSMLARFTAESPLRLEGVMTHFHSAEELGNPAARKQAETFVSAIDTIYECGHNPRILSAGNSANLLVENGTDTIHHAARQHGAKFMVRPGLALYGYSPDFDGASLPGKDDLQPVLTWKTRVISLREIQPGETAGYNATFRAKRMTRLALLPVGYADGLNRLLSNKGHVLIHGQRAPIAGRISMDQTMVDVTEISDVAPGDEVMLIGTQNGHSITAYDLADLTGTIPYEVLCAIGARVPRAMVD